MPSVDATLLEPGRSSAREKKRAVGAVEVGVMPNRLAEMAAPSGASDVVGGIFWAMTELRGRARPRTPAKLEERGSSLTVEAATGGGM